MNTIPQPEPQHASQLHQPARPEDLLEELRGDVALLELQLTMVYRFIERRLGLSREMVIRTIAEYHEVEE